MYINVILPLPLDGVFTYSVPKALDSDVRVGARVLVPFGRNKTYVGVIETILLTNEGLQPEVNYKEILQVLDVSPILLDSQLRLWKWIADYYMSPLGDVYKAALPAGLKAEDGYRPKTELHIRVTQKFRSEQALHVAIDMLRRAPSQQKAFVDFLDLASPDYVAGVTRDELMNQGHTSSTITTLVKRGFLETYEQEVGRLNHGGEPHPERIKPLSVPQQDAYNQILLSFMKKSVTLLHGVTSSGKTEIYIHLIQQALEKRQQVLYLLPEIALTVQMMDRLQRIFGNRLGIYHSKYSDAERVEIWQKQLSSHPYDVILGARSAVFLPFQHLGLVIVDEEHETSYKQQDPAPRYHARSAAIMLAQFFSRNEEEFFFSRYEVRGSRYENRLSADNSALKVTSYLVPRTSYLEIPRSSNLVPRILLGTATPSLESYHNAQTGKYGYVRLTERHQGVQLPEVEVVDIGDLQHRRMMNGPFSPLLLSRVREALDRGEQAILFQNRRGYAPMLECKKCGWVPRCQHCDVTLTLHRQLNQLSCHYCGAVYQVPTVCPGCGSPELQGRGYGTEKVETEVRDIFPEARISRMDLDTTRSRHAYERIISDFGSGRTNLLIGTQMVSKGLDFGRVSVVGILNADAMLNQPDFRAYEHAYMMMTQVSGRAGRRGKRGLVVLQTRQPQLPLIGQVIRNDYTAFYNDQCDERRAFRYPPFCRLVYVFVKHRQERLVESAAITLGSWLRQWFGTRVLGPDKPAVAKVKTLAIRKLIVKLEPGLNMTDVRKYLALARQQLLQDKRFASLQVYFDVDPL